MSAQTDGRKYMLTKVIQVLYSYGMKEILLCSDWHGNQYTEKFRIKMSRPVPLALIM